MLNATLSEVVDTEDRQGMLDAYRSRPKQLARWLLISRKQVKEKYRATEVERLRTTRNLGAHVVATSGILPIA